MDAKHYALRLPDLGLDNFPMSVSCWLVPLGGSVVQGDRVLEVLAGDVTVDLPAPATGLLVQRRVQEDDPLTVGQVVGIIRAIE